MKVFIVCRYDNYDLRIRYVEKYFVRLGAEVTIIIGDFNHITKSQANYTYTYDNLRYVHIKPYKSNLSFGRILADISFAKRVHSILNEENPDIIYAIVPPNMIVRELSRYKRNHASVKLIYDVFDLWPESFPSKLINKNKIWRKLRDNNLHNADRVFIECKYYESFISNYIDSQKISVLYLTKEYLPIKKVYPSKDCVGFLYLGSINNIIDIDSIVSFLSQVSHHTNVKLHIIGDGNRRDEFLNQLESKSINYEYYGIVYDEQKKKTIYDACHYAINMYREGVKIGLTMKSLDYFQNCIPVINMNIVDTGNLIDSYKCGFNLTHVNLSEVAKTVAQQSEQSWSIMSNNTNRLMKDCFSEEAFNGSFVCELNSLINEGT